ncbi:MAG TPA: ATP-binding protein [Planctomycetota bacterium]|nr:ATP-binding protein [Planctomycetota bacterium]
MRKPLRILIVEDSEDDALLLLRELRHGGYDPLYKRVDTGEAMRAQLHSHPWDVVVSDYQMPAFSGPDALLTLQECGLDLPFIICSGVIGEEVAVAVMKKGAHDYLIKGNLKRLVPVIEREIREAASRALRRQAQVELRDSEEQFRLLTENSNDWITRHTPEGVYRYVSGACRGLLGYEPQDLIGHTPCEFVDPAHCEALRQALADAAQSHSRERFEYRFRRKDGRLIWFETAFWTRQDPVTGAVLEIQAATREITERKQAEAALQEAHDQLELRVHQRTADLQAANLSLSTEIAERRRIEAEREQLNRELETKNKQLESLLMNAEKLASVGRLAAGVAHEIRNPLTSLKLSLFSIGKAVKGNTKIEDNVRVMSEEILRLETVVRNFLEFSRPPSLRLRPTAVRALIDDLLSLYRHQLSKANVTTHIDVPLDLPQVNVDPDQIKQVFLNLLVNAVDAMKNGGSIQITAETVPGEGGTTDILFRFQDSGPGIPEEVRAKIFEAFFTTKTEGTGLGLAISSRIMKNHGGSLTLDSESTPGATFLARIPVTDVPST